MLMITRFAAVGLCALAVASCKRSTDSQLIGEWSCPSIDPEARVIYKPDHTYTAWIHNTSFNGSATGTWRVEGDRIICRDSKQADSELQQLIYRDKPGESKGQIVKLTRNELQVKAPDGITREYQRAR
jgi:hypothetical protein